MFVFATMRKAVSGIGRGQGAQETARRRRGGHRRPGGGLRRRA